MIEIPLNGIVAINDRWYICEESPKVQCNGCGFSCPITERCLFSYMRCSDTERIDKKEVIFRQIPTPTPDNEYR